MKTFRLVLLSCVAAANGWSQASLKSKDILVGSGSVVPITGDCTLSSSGQVTCTKTGGVSFAPSATVDTTNASNITSGTLPGSVLPVIAGTAQTAWSAGTAYVANQQVNYLGQILQRVSAGTSGGSFTASEAGNWRFAGTSSINSFGPGAYYYVGALVTNSNIVYQRTLAGVALTNFVLDADNWNPITNFTSVPVSNLNPAVRAWTAGTAYSVNAQVSYFGQLLQRTSGGTSGASFTAGEAGSWSFIGVTIPQAWQAATYYYQGAEALNGAYVYTHNSGSVSGARTFAGDSGNWTQMNLAAVGVWSPNTSYTANTVVTLNGQLVLRAAAGVSGAVFGAVEAGSWIYLSTTPVAWTAASYYYKGSLAYSDGAIYSRNLSGISSGGLFSADIANWTSSGNPWFDLRQNTSLGVTNVSQTVTTGTYNTGVGYHALNANTSGSGNVAVGTGALQINTSGSNNAAHGLGALGANSSGSSNSGFGNAALGSNTVGYGNAALGASALSSNTTGFNNTAVGNSALQNNTVGRFNNAVGYGALYATVAGSSNNGVGNNALLSNTTGDLNNGVGFGALSSNVTGVSNNAMGAVALYSNTSGNLNSAQGYYAGVPSGLVFASAGSTVAGSPAVGLSSTTGFSVGQTVWTTNGSIPAGATIAAVNGGVGITLSTTATSSGAATIYSSMNAEVNGNNNTFIGTQTGFSSALQNDYQTDLGSGTTGSCNNCINLGRKDTDTVNVQGILAGSSNTPTASVSGNGCGLGAITGNNIAGKILVTGAGESCSIKITFTANAPSEFFCGDLRNRNSGSRAAQTGDTASSATFGAIAINAGDTLQYGSCIGN